MPASSKNNPLIQMASAIYPPKFGLLYVNLSIHSTAITINKTKFDNYIIIYLTFLTYSPPLLEMNVSLAGHRSLS